MDKETLSNYGWVVIAVLVLSVMIALATPFGTYISNAVKSTTEGLFQVEQKALGAAGITIDSQEFESCEHDYDVTTTANCTTAGTTTYTCKLCNKSYSEETPAGHKYDDTGLKCTECGVTVVEYSFTPSDYDAKMGTTTKTDSVVVVPETFEYNGKTYKVTSIGSQAFFYCTSLESIDLPDSITAIGNSAFYNCTNLKSIDIPEGVMTIGGGAFTSCASLKSINIPEGVTTIGSSTFSECTSLESITLPDSVTTIGYNAFSDCTSLTSITIPEGLTTIDEYAFFYCTALKSINIPKSITTIGRLAFQHCDSLTSITLPNSITTIANAAFAYCKSLTSVTIPDSVTTIDSYAFSDCTSLTSITFEGTMEQWNAITKASKYAWNENIPATQVICSDGTVSLS